MKSKKILGYSLIALISIYSSTSTPQTVENDSGATYRRWVLSVSFGPASSGPAKMIEELMTSAGFNETDGFGLSSTPGQEHPYSLTGLDFQRGPSWLIGTYYMFKPPFSAGVIVGNTKIGTTWGYREPVYLDINYAVTTFAIVFNIQVGDIVRLGAGPAIHFPKANTSAFRAEDQGKIDSKAGFLLDFGVALPSKTGFFLQVELQYRHVGGVQIGPFETESAFFSSILPATQVSYNHWFVGLGLGIGQ